MDFKVQEIARDLSEQKWKMEHFLKANVSGLDRNVRTEQQKEALKVLNKMMKDSATVTFEKYEVPEKSATDENESKEVEAHKCTFSSGETGTWTVRNRAFPQRSKFSAPSNRVIDEYAYERFMEMGPVLEIEVLDKEKKSIQKGKSTPVIVYSIPLRRVEFQKSKIRSASQGLIRWKPARKAKSSAIVGLAGFHSKSGPNIVDPRWSRGRKWYWSRKNGFRLP